MEGVVLEINVRKTLRSMTKGTVIWLEGVNEGTLRNTAVKLRNAKEGLWSVDKKTNPDGFYITRLA